MLEEEFEGILRRADGLIDLFFALGRPVDVFQLGRRSCDAGDFCVGDGLGVLFEGVEGYFDGGGACVDGEDGFVGHFGDGGVFWGSYSYSDDDR